MANRNYNPVRGAGFGMVTYAGGFLPVGGAGTISNIDGAAWFSVARTGVGLYTLTLQSTVPQIYAASFSVSSVSGGTNYFCRLNLTTGVSLNSLVSTTGAIPLLVTDAANVAADPPNNAASVVYFHFFAKNSTVTG